jgi:hypothetical protein
MGQPFSVTFIVSQNQQMLNIDLPTYLLSLVIFIFLSFYEVDSQACSPFPHFGRSCGHFGISKSGIN